VLIQFPRVKISIRDNEKEQRYLPKKKKRSSMWVHWGVTKDSRPSHRMTTLTLISFDSLLTLLSPLGTDRRESKYVLVLSMSDLVQRSSCPLPPPHLVSLSHLSRPPLWITNHPRPSLALPSLYAPPCGPRPPHRSCPLPTTRSRHYLLFIPSPVSRALSDLVLHYLINAFIVINTYIFLILLLHYMS
jgi:hypothetical protein